MIIHNFHAMCFAVAPDETDPPLVVDSNTMLSGPIPLERLQAIPRWHAKVLQACDSVKIKELPPRHALDRTEPKNSLILEKRLRVPASEGSYQPTSVYDAVGIPSRGIWGATLTLPMLGHPLGAAQATKVFKNCTTAGAARC